MGIDFRSIAGCLILSLTSVYNPENMCPTGMARIVFDLGYDEEEGRTSMKTKVVGVVERLEKNLKLLEEK